MRLCGKEPRSAAGHALATPKRGEGVKRIVIAVLPPR